jgi:hypothetical protein
MAHNAADGGAFDAAMSTCDDRERSDEECCQQRDLPHFEFPHATNEIEVIVVAKM